MQATPILLERVSSAVAGVFTAECSRDAQLVSVPRPEVHVVARFLRNGVDVHAMGPRHAAHRKVIRAGQRTVMARLELGAAASVLGVPAAAIAGQIVELETLWGAAATRVLLDELAHARSTVEAGAIMERAIAERSRGDVQHRLVRVAAERLATSDVSSVAHELGVSERHLRRVFHDAVGVSPKMFAKLARFHRALRAARDSSNTSWASIAVAAGYYDQAHLIHEFRAIAGVTPPVLLRELLH